MEFHVAKAVLFQFRDSDDIQRIKFCYVLVYLFIFALRVISGRAPHGGLGAAEDGHAHAPQGAPGPAPQGNGLDFLLPRILHTIPRHLHPFKTSSSKVTI